jgi:CRP-like cAMP-binding protein
MFEVFEKYLESKFELGTEELASIKAVSIFKKLRKHQFLLQEGDVWAWNAFVCKGCLRTFRVDEKGGEHAQNFAIENWWTGDRESLMTGKPSEYNIDAVENSVVLLISKKNFEDLCASIPLFNDFINNVLQKSFNAAQKRIMTTISYSAEEKYLNFIKTRSDIANRIPQHMIASYLGISAETLSRIRKQIANK